ncbi:hypothetical protein [Deinococcus sp.]|uniref:hypothetical protein n=1 Tax=Deinococcus sp. TaxID=47478 RepID=UPI0025C0675D|nr:hypothetical protein [Deinococcus sp.]
MALSAASGTAPEPRKKPRTAQEFKTKLVEDRAKRRAEKEAKDRPADPVAHYAQYAPAPIRLQLEPQAQEFTPTATLTACLETAECPKLARRLFQVLHELALYSVRARGLPAVGLTVGVFHLPLELLAAHFQVNRTTIWRNLQPLLTAGLLDARDHCGKLRGKSAVTGKIWAVSILPERQLDGHAEPVKVRHYDLTAKWRNLDADAESDHTVWSLTRTEEQKVAYKAQQLERAAEIAEARSRAEERAKERKAAMARGEKVLTGRAAATVNAAQTRAEKPRPTRKKTEMQQSFSNLKTWIETVRRVPIFLCSSRLLHSSY